MPIEDLTFLKWPEDRQTLAQLSMSELIMWYAGLDPRELVYMGQTAEFQRFWFRHYLLPLRIKRFFYKIKGIFYAR